MSTTNNPKFSIFSIYASNAFRIFTEYAKILSIHSPHMFKYFLHILRERMKDMQIEIFISTISGTLKGHSFEKSNWCLYTGIGRTVDKFYFLVILKENTHYGTSQLIMD